MKKHPTYGKGICLASLLAVISFVLMIVMILSANTPDNSEFSPPDFDKQAKSGIPMAQIKSIVYMKIADTTVGLTGDTYIQDALLNIQLYNAAGNNVWIKLRAYDADGQVIGETGLIKPNQHIEAVALEKDVSAGDALALKVMCYQPETYYSEGSATVNITVTAKK